MPKNLFLIYYAILYIFVGKIVYMAVFLELMDRMFCCYLKMSVNAMYRIIYLITVQKIIKKYIILFLKEKKMRKFI